MLHIDLMQLEFIELLLRQMITETYEALRVEGTITSLYRIDDTGVHGTLKLRGIDTSCKDKEFGEFMEDYVNSRWQYDPKRFYKKCCTYHKTDSGEWHLHWQVHPNTRRI